MTRPGPCFVPLRASGPGRPLSSTLASVPEMPSLPALHRVATGCV